MTPELCHLYPSWEIIRLLGEGAFGKVYEIRRGEDELEERAALKVIHIPRSESEIKLLQSEGADVSAHFEELARQLSNEIATQAKLKGNSNIVSYEDRKIVPDADGIGQTILIRMELLKPLVDIMAAGAIGQAEVLQLGLDMARALLLCERFHIIHRDIKPQNIFISPAGDYKLGDFGVARQLEQTTANLSRKGTYNYMAPEVFHGRPCNATVDIYSLGIVLYTLLNGNHAPFLPSSVTGSTVTSHDRDEAQTKRLSGEALPPLPHVPAALNEVILRMCAFDPKERYQSARDLMAALEGAAHELQSEKTVGLFSWSGDNTSRVVPPMDATENEGSRWIDGTPVTKEKIPEPKPALIPESAVQSAPRKSPGKALVAVLVGVVAVLAVVVAWIALRGSDNAMHAGGGTSSLVEIRSIMPDVVSHTLEEAIAMLDEASILYEIEYAGSEKVAKNIVMEQSVEKGAETNESVVLIVSKTEYVTNRDIILAYSSGITSEASFTGYWEDDAPRNNSEGTYSQDDGTEYIGNWDNGMPNGQGTFHYSYGDVYVGNWVNGLQDGQGTRTMENGDTYVGSFKNGYYDGYGTYTGADGMKHVGNWKEGQPDGYGTRYHANGDKYVGNYKDGKWHGEGTYTWAAGNYWVGSFKNGVEDGYGIDYDASGNVLLEGYWREGKFVG